MTKGNKFPTITPLQPMPQCSEPNQCMHMNLFDPCKTSNMGKKYVFTITNAFTKYAEICTIPNRRKKPWQTWYLENGFADMDAHQPITQIK
jgi:hypothetical protein